MEDYLIIAFIALVVGFGIFSAVKHFKGQGGCCGGGGYKPKKKKLKNVLYKKTFAVKGMHCNHCKTRVEEVVNDVKGLAGRVDLKKEKLTVFYAVEVSDDVIIQRIERLGYTINKTEDK